MVPAPLLLLLAKATIVLVAALGDHVRACSAPPPARATSCGSSTLGALLLVPALARVGPLRCASCRAAGPRPCRDVVPARRTRSPRRPHRARRRAPHRHAEHAPTTTSAPIGDGERRRRACAIGLDARSDRAVGRRRRSRSPRRSCARGSPCVASCAARARSSPRTGSRRCGRSPIASRSTSRRALLRSDDAKMPFACGLARPTIVLPAECDAWTPDRRRAVLLHELAHVRRRDLLGHTLARRRVRRVLVPSARVDRGEAAARRERARVRRPRAVVRGACRRTTPSTCSTS